MYLLYTPYVYTADEGKDWAQFNLGITYLRGEDGFDKNLPEAAKYTQMAVEKGYVRAQYQLGYLYEEGLGVPQDWEKSFHWYLKAANQGYAMAQNNVGTAFYLGKGIEKDMDQAFIWYKKSADLGDDVAQYNLGKNESVYMYHIAVC